MKEIPRPSPNCEPRHSSISMIVLHDTEGAVQGALSWFADPASQVSAHVVIDKQGNIYRCVADEMKAYHVRGHNDFSLGVELEMNTTDPPGSFPDIQLNSAIEWIAEKCKQYKIPLNRIVSHAELDPTRRTDPRGLNFYEFLLGVADAIMRLP